MGNLEKSNHYFLECQDVVRLQEVYYLQARLYDAQKNFVSRDEKSKLFVEVSRQLAKGSLPVGLGDISSTIHLQQMARRQVHVTAL